MNHLQPRTSLVNMKETSTSPRVLQHETSCFTTDAETYWPEWQCYYDEGLDMQTTAPGVMCAAEAPQLEQQQLETQSQWNTRTTPPSACRSPVQLAGASRSPTFSTSAKSPEESLPDGRLLKRKAQNRAALVFTIRLT